MKLKSKVGMAIIIFLANEHKAAGTKY